LFQTQRAESGPHVLLEIEICKAYETRLKVHNGIQEIKTQMKVPKKSYREV
jgi:hypothetical protein